MINIPNHYLGSSPDQARGTAASSGGVVVPIYVKEKTTSPPPRAVVPLS